MNDNLETNEQYLKYYNGQKIMVGDRVLRHGKSSSISIVTGIFGPKHEISVYHENANGSVEITHPQSSVILPLPIEEDVKLVKRCEERGQP